MTLNLSYIFVVFNKTLRVSEESGAREAGEVSQPMRALQDGARGPVLSKLTTKHRQCGPKN